MEYTEKELEIIESFKKGFEDNNMVCKTSYDFGTRREGLTERVKNFLRTLGTFEENDVCYGVKFVR